MGTYLSTPVLDKCTEIGRSDPDGEYPVSWAVADMQGWRKSMEDAHIACANVELPRGFKGGGGGGESGGGDGGDGGGGGGEGDDGEEGEGKESEAKTGEIEEEETEGGADGTAAATPPPPAAAASAPEEGEPPAEEKPVEENEKKRKDLARVFAVFDGHGGPEVARFCQLYLVDVLTGTDGWSGRGGGAAEGGAGSGLGFRPGTPALEREEEEEGAQKPRRGKREKRDSSAPTSTAEATSAAAQDEAKEAKEEAEGDDEDKEEGAENDERGDDDGVDDDESSPAAASASAPSPPSPPGDEELKRRIGEALVDCFHAVDRMIDDPGRREEIALLRVEKPRPGEMRTVVTTTAEEVGVGRKEDYSFPAVPTSPPGTKRSEWEKKEEEEKEAETDAAEQSREAETKEDETKEEDKKEKEKEKGAGADDDDDENDGEAPSSGDESGGDEGKDESAAEASEVEETKDEAEATEKAEGDDDGGADEAANGASKSDENDDDGNEGGDDDADDKRGGVSAADAVSLFRKLLTGQHAGAKTTDDIPANGEAAAARQMDGPSVTQPTRIQNGRQVCNLPDHPIHAGCTSVVAVLVGNTLTVANAGDSRAVLCRSGGRAEALSFDHKPLHDIERRRITQAGGFVNQFGRVNGNLNLSRSIGDLKYKQVPGVPPSGQMITAEPDVMQVTLRPGEDEFLLLGCDGIWDCLTNAEAVRYVRDRIQDEPPLDICREILDEIVSDDPRASQGIGGDNMTLMIVDLLPQTRSYYGGNDGNGDGDGVRGQ